MKKQMINRFNLTLVLIPLFLLLLNSCTKDEPLTLYTSEPTPVSIKSFEVKDVYHGQERTYKMSMETLQDAPANEVIFCNFANYKIYVKAFVEEGQVSILPHSFSTEYHDLEIYDGMGILSDDELKITFWGQEDGQEFSHEIEGGGN